LRDWKAGGLSIIDPLRIYVAGPYCPTNCSLHNASKIAQKNVDRAIEAGNRIIEKGHFVFVPHLSHFIHVHYSCKMDYGDWWYDEDNTFLENWANALLFLGSSKGADSELELAKSRSLRIFYDVDEVPRLTKGF
jgi:hypothetical protein